MSSLSKKWFVIINPTSGNGKSKKNWPKIKQLLDLHGFEFEFAFTANTCHIMAKESVADFFKGLSGCLKKGGLFFI